MKFEIYLIHCGFFYQNSMDKINIAIIGAGGVGGYFAWKFMRNVGDYTTLTLVARGRHYEEIRRHGLGLESPESNGESLWPDFLFSHIDEADVNDIILLCVKDYDLSGVLDGIKKIVHSNSVIVPLMNGVDIYSRVKSAFPNHQVLSACVYVASHIKAPGVVEHKGKPGEIIAGADPAFPDVDLDWLTETFHGAKINFTLKADASEEIRSKFLFIASFGLISARYNKSIGEILANPELDARTNKLLLEYAAVLFDLNETERRVKVALERARAFPYDTRTSLQLDIHGGKAPDRNELDLYLRPIMKDGPPGGSLAMRLADEIREAFMKSRT